MGAGGGGGGDAERPGPLEGSQETPQNAKFILHVADVNSTKDFRLTGIPSCQSTRMLNKVKISCIILV